MDIKYLIKMDLEHLRKIVWEPRETAKLDFKIEPYKIYEPKPNIQKEIADWEDKRERQWGELVKDIIALANGNIRTAKQTGYLIIGADDKLKDDGTAKLESAGNFPTSKEILDKVNSYCSPKVPEIQREEFLLDGFNLIVVSIPPSPYLYKLSKVLKVPKIKEYSPYTVLIRREDGESTYEASQIEAETIEKEKRGHLPTSIQLEADLQKGRRISKHELTKKAWRGFSNIIVVALLFIVFFAFCSWSNQSLSIPQLIFLSCILGLFWYFFIEPYHEEMNLYFKKPRNKNEAVFIGQEKCIEDDEEGGYLIYNPTAPCIYPGCDRGKIVLTDAPSREKLRGGRNYVGVCNIAGRDHSYRVDYNFHATKAEFDWSEPSPKK
jgi:hypothetical protein